MRAREIRERKREQKSERERERERESLGLKRLDTSCVERQANARLGKFYGCLRAVWELSPQVLLPALRASVCACACSCVVCLCILSLKSLDAEPRTTWNAVCNEQIQLSLCGGWRRACSRYACGRARLVSGVCSRQRFRGWADEHPSVFGFAPRSVICTPSGVNSISPA